MAPAPSKILFDYLCQNAKNLHYPVAMGEFGAHMQVTLSNDGPVTFLLKT
jgi:D-tyrosyl-tRNA(Tyr) deacylase